MENLSLKENIPTDLHPAVAELLKLRSLNKKVTRRNTNKSLSSVISNIKDTNNCNNSNNNNNKDRIIKPKTSISSLRSNNIGNNSIESEVEMIERSESNNNLRASERSSYALMEDVSLYKTDRTDITENTLEITNSKDFSPNINNNILSSNKSKINKKTHNNKNNNFNINEFKSKFNKETTLYKANTYINEEISNANSIRNSYSKLVDFKNKAEEITDFCSNINTDSNNDNKTKLSFNSTSSEVKLRRKDRRATIYISSNEIFEAKLDYNMKCIDSLLQKKRKKSN